MRMASYRVNGIDTFGVVHGDPSGGNESLFVSDAALLRGPRTLREWLAGGAAARAVVTEEPARDHAWADVEPLPVVPDPAKIVCVGVNYVDHRAEASRAPAEHPTLFTRFSDTQMGHLAPAAKPEESEKFDYEGEVAVVIGRACHRVTAEDAAAFIGGYACYDDFTARDWQRHTHQWTPGKNFPQTGGFGPWLVTLDELPADVRELELTTTVNGETRQRAHLADLIFDIPALIEYVTAFTPLAPGDVLVTGTPGGVGFFRDPQLLLSPDDVVEVSVTGLGTLRNTVC